MTEIRLVNNKDYLRGLVDTGSPVNWLKEKIYRKYFRDCELSKEKMFWELKGARNALVEEVGGIKTKIASKQIANKEFEIDLIVVSHKDIMDEIIWGTQFLAKDSLAFKYNKNNVCFYLTQHETINEQCNGDEKQAIIYYTRNRKEG